MTIKTGIRSLASVIMFAVIFFGVAAQAQQTTATQQRSSSLELTYDYVRTNGPPNGCGCIGLNGGGAAYVHPLRSTPISIIGSVGVTHASGISLPGYTLTLFTYTAGARYVPHMKSPLFQPYGEIQVGGVHASGTLATTPSLAGSSISSAFAATAGGGINLLFHRRIGFKLVDAEYLTTNYANGSTDHQNDLRISSGLIFSFCSSKTCSVTKK